MTVSILIYDGDGVLFSVFKLKKEDVVKENKYSLLIGWIDILYTQSMEYFTTVTTTLPIYIQTMLSIVE